MSLRVAQRLARQDVRARVLDLRWLAPLTVEDLVNNAAACGRVLVVDETRRSGGVSESVCTILLDNGWHGEVSRVTSTDSFVPLGPAAQHVLLDEATIETAAGKLLVRRSRGLSNPRAHHHPRLAHGSPLLVEHRLIPRAIVGIGEGVSGAQQSVVSKALTSTTC